MNNSKFLKNDDVSMLAKRHYQVKKKIYIYIYIYLQVAVYIDQKNNG